MKEPERMWDDDRVDAMMRADLAEARVARVHYDEEAGLRRLQASIGLIVPVAPSASAPSASAPSASAPSASAPPASAPPASAPPASAPPASAPPASVPPPVPPPLAPAALGVPSAVKVGLTLVTAAALGGAAAWWAQPGPPIVSDSVDTVFATGARPVEDSSSESATAESVGAESSTPSADLAARAADSSPVLGVDPAAPARASTPAPGVRSGPARRGRSRGDAPADRPAAPARPSAHSLSPQRATPPGATAPRPIPPARAAATQPPPSGSVGPALTVPSERTPRAAEIAHLAQLRAMLRRDPARALDMANLGQRRFRGGLFAAEREGLAVLALVQLGRQHTARQRGLRYLARYPRGTYAERVRRAIGDL